MDLKDSFLESATRGRCSLENWYKVKPAEKKQKGVDIQHGETPKGKRAKGLGEVRIRFIAC